MKNSTLPQSSRKIAQKIGIYLILMAVLAGVSMPNLGANYANYGLIGILILDILVSFGICEYYQKNSPILSKISSFLRIIYSIILAIAIIYAFGGDISKFTSIWGMGLIAFGLHLISLGLLFDREGGQKWLNLSIKALLIIAGIGYCVQYIGILIVPNPIEFAALMTAIFVLPMILGELLFAVWMLISGGKSSV